MDWRIWIQAVAAGVFFWLALHDRGWRSIGWLLLSMSAIVMALARAADMVPPSEGATLALQAAALLVLLIAVWMELRR